MREAKKKGATRFTPTAAPGVGNSDKVANSATKDNLSLEDRIVKEAKKAILNLPVSERAGVIHGDLLVITNSERLEELIRKVVRNRLKNLNS